MGAHRSERSCKLPSVSLNFFCSICVDQTIPAELHERFRGESAKFAVLRVREVAVAQLRNCPDADEPRTMRTIAEVPEAVPWHSVEFAVLRVGEVCHCSTAKLPGRGRDANCADNRLLNPFLPRAIFAMTRVARAERSAIIRRRFRENPCLKCCGAHHARLRWSHATLFRS